MSGSARPVASWYNCVWRWHFYAGLFCIPFVLWLACTGAIYLWKPQIESLIDRPYDHLTIPGPRASAADQVAAAIAAVPGSALHQYELPEGPNSAVRVIVGSGSEKTRVYVHPQSLAILKTVNEDDRLMRVIFRLHGELMMGDFGSYIVELAASWAIVMILTGLYLWWPRGANGAAGLVYPRLRSGRRVFWRDLHAVTGLWVSFFALFLLLSGLPWSAAWGGYLKTARTVSGGAVVKQDWTTGRSAELRDRVAEDVGKRKAMGEHAQHGGPSARMHSHQGYAPLDRLVGAVGPLDLAPPVLIAPPTRPDGPWTAKSDAANRPLRTTLTLDGASGAILSREDFRDRQIIDRVVGYGVAAHEGQLFGLANQLLGLLTAASLILLSVSSVVLWWRRRPDGALGAPIPLRRPRYAWWFGGVVLFFALLLPLLGMSLILVGFVERLILRRIPGVRDWLGLQAPMKNA